MIKTCTEKTLWPSPSTHQTVFLHGPLLVICAKEIQQTGSSSPGGVLVFLCQNTKRTHSMRTHIQLQRIYEITMQEGNKYIDASGELYV